MKKRGKRDYTVKAPENHPVVQKKIQDTLNRSVKEGSVASLSTGFGISYLSAFALLLNATASQVGVLYAIANFLPSLVQLKASELLERFSRKSITLFAVGSRILLWVPIILVGFLYYMGYSYMMFVLIVLAALFYSFRATGQLAWFSWIGSLVPVHKRGKYFSRRNRAIGFFSIVALLTASLILDTSKKYGVINGDVLLYTIIGFSALFTLAMISKAISFALLTVQYEPRIKVRKKDEVSFKEFLKNITKNDWGRFSLFRFFVSFAVAIAGPFWAVYMLRDLGFSYFWFTSVTVFHMMFQIAFLPVMGKISDKFGNVRLIKISLIGISLVPILWLMSTFITDDFLLKIYLLSLPSFVTGVFWGGYNLAVNNYLYDSIGPRKRGFEISHMNFMVGMGMSLGAGFGSLLALLDIPFMDTILFIFLISGVLRILVSIVGSRYLREVRDVEEFSSEWVLNEINPIEGLKKEVHHKKDKVTNVQHYI